MLRSNENNKIDRLEFVRSSFSKEIKSAIEGIVDNKGVYQQYIHVIDHFIKIDFEVIDGVVIVGDIFFETNTEIPTEMKQDRFRWWVKISGSLDEALVDLVASAQRLSGYKPMDVVD